MLENNFPLTNVKHINKIQHEESQTPDSSKEKKGYKWDRNRYKCGVKTQSKLIITSFELKLDSIVKQKVNPNDP